MVSATRKLFVIGLILVSIWSLLFSGFAANSLPRPYMNQVGQLMSMWIAIIQKNGNQNLAGIPMYQAFNGLEHFTVYTPATYGMPRSVYIDSSRFFTERRIYLKVCYEPVVVENIKIASTLDTHYNADGSGLDYSTLGSGAALEKFMLYQCRYMGEMLTDPQMLAVWMSMVAGATWVKNLGGLLDWAGMNPDGTPYDGPDTPLSAPATTFNNDQSLYNAAEAGSFSDVPIYSVTRIDAANMIEAARPFLNTATWIVLVLCIGLVMLHFLKAPWRLATQ